MLQGVRRGCKPPQDSPVAQSAFPARGVRAGSNRSEPSSSAPASTPHPHINDYISRGARLCQHEPGIVTVESAVQREWSMSRPKSPVPDCHRCESFLVRLLAVFFWCWIVWSSFFFFLDLDAVEVRNKGFFFMSSMIYSKFVENGTLTRLLLDWNVNSYSQ